MPKNPELIALFLLRLVFTIFVSCSIAHSETTAVASELLIGIADDKTASVGATGIPVLKMAHLEEFIKAVKTNGGILAYGTIDERSFHPLTSMQIRKVVGRLDERAAINQRNNASLKTFKETAEPLLNHPRNARRTDIAGSLERFELFFDEPTSSEAKKIFIMISDGLDTTSRRAGLYKIRLPEGTEIYTIGIEKTLAKNIFGQKVKCLESLEAALRTLAIQAR